MNVISEELKKDILQVIQEGIPFEKRPFKPLANKIGISEEEFIENLKHLKEEKIIRQISPIYDTKVLGYDSSLVAFKSPKDKINETAKIINEHPGVSHNYERNNDFNIWFTIAVPPDSQIGLDKSVEILAKKSGVEDYAILRSVKVYKIGVKLNFKGKSDEKEKVEKREYKPKPLSEMDKEIIRITQEDLPLVDTPFKEYAKILNLSEEQLLEKLEEFKKEKIMRRFAAILYHRKAGFKANGMAVWNVPEEIVDEIGYTLSTYKAVSHCYTRTTNEKWKYNLFSMIHGTSKEEVEEIAKKMSDETGIKDYTILYSTVEFKKQRIKYFTQDIYNWEKENENWIK